MNIVDIKTFLDRFRIKAKTFGLKFRMDRNKNFQGLLDLEINAQKRESIVMELEPEDYYKGPTENTLNDDGDLWEFGKSIKKKEAYIKLAEGKDDDSAVCVSFHSAERKIKYPFKSTKNETK